MSSAEGELLAVVYALSKYQQYLGRTEFDLVTDSRALTYLNSTKNLNAKLARWAIYLAEFNFIVQHKAGVNHTNADGLTRCPGATEDPQFPSCFHSCLMEDDHVAPLPEAGADLEKEIASLNISRKEYLASLPCSICGELSERMMLCDGCD